MGRRDGRADLNTASRDRRSTTAATPQATRRCIRATQPTSSSSGLLALSAVQPNAAPIGDLGRQTATAYVEKNCWTTK